MILIKNIEFYQVDGDESFIYHASPFESFLVNTEKGADLVPVEAVRELVIGRRFYRPTDNEIVVVGLSKQVQDVLGIHYEAWENVNEENKKLYSDVKSYRTKLNKITNASFFERLKWLFKGVK